VSRGRPDAASGRAAVARGHGFPAGRRILAALVLAALAVAAPPAAAGEGRFHLGVTVSGHIMLHGGWEQTFAADASWRADLFWAPSFTPNGGWQAAVVRRWPLHGEDPWRFADRGNEWTLAAGFLQLWARETDGTWRHLSLPHLAPGHRWGLGDTGRAGIEAPVCWFHAKRRVVPIGFMLRWQ